MCVFLFSESGRVTAGASFRTPRLCFPWPGKVAGKALAPRDSLVQASLRDVTGIRPPDAQLSSPRNGALAQTRAQNHQFAARASPPPRGGSTLPRPSSPGDVGLWISLTGQWGR